MAVRSVGWLAGATAAGLVLAACASDAAEDEVVQPPPAVTEPAGGDAEVEPPGTDEPPGPDDDGTEGDDDGDDTGDGEVEVEGDDDDEGDGGDDPDEADDGGADGDAEEVAGFEPGVDPEVAEERGWRPMTVEEAEAWRAPGGAGELFGPASQMDELASDAHRIWWNRFGPGGSEFPGWEWVNKDELWDEVMGSVWADATARFGTRLRDRPGTVFPGLNTSANAVWTWSKHTDGDADFGWFGIVHVGVDPDDATQARPDVAIYGVQIAVTETGDGTSFEGTHTAGGGLEGRAPWILSGETPGGSSEQDVRTAIIEQWPDTDGETLDPVGERDERAEDQ